MAKYGAHIVQSVTLSDGYAFPFALQVKLQEYSYGGADLGDGVLDTGGNIGYPNAKSGIPAHITFKITSNLDAGKEYQQVMLPLLQVANYIEIVAKDEVNGKLLSIRLENPSDIMPGATRNTSGEDIDIKIQGTKLNMD
jgi:hypothetical protein